MTPQEYDEDEIANMVGRHITRLAKQAGLPRGWYEGPYVDEDGQLQTGIPPCLIMFVYLIEKAALAQQDDAAFVDGTATEKEK